MTGRIRRLLADEAALHAALRPVLPQAALDRRLFDRASDLARDWPQLGVAEIRQMLLRLLTRVSLHADRVDLHVRRDGLAGLLAAESKSISLDPAASMAKANTLILSVHASLRRAGREVAMVIGADPTTAPVSDPAMMRLILRARSMWEKLQRSEVAGLGELAAQEGLSGSYASRLIRLAFLAPDILQAIMDARQPAGLSAAALLQECRRGLPLDWQQQREALGFR